MADDFGDKTEAPTPRRRAEAREQGNIARSQDLTAAILILGVMMLLSSVGPKLVMALRTLLSEMLGGPSMQHTDELAVLPIAWRAFALVLQALAPLFIGIIVLGVVANIAQVGFHFSGKRIQPNFAAANPLKGLSRIFSKGQTLVQLGMNVLKLLLISGVAYSAVSGRIAQIVLAQQLDFLSIFRLGMDVIYSIAIRLGLLMLLLAIIDYAYQRFRIERELKMSKQEVKDEMRRMDGDPQIKARRREIAKQIALQRIKKDVPTADVVVTNPTEFAVALKYDSDAMHAPRVIAKGRGFMAARIREVAVAAGVPILERKPLARALYRLVEVGQEIPEQFYAAVAEILAYVYELTGKTTRKVPIPA